jgi:hypothetical protein
MEEREGLGFRVSGSGSRVGRMEEREVGGVALFERTRK